MWIYVPPWFPWLLLALAVPLLLFGLWLLGQLVLRLVGLLNGAVLCVLMLLFPRAAERFENWQRRQNGFIPYPGDPRYNPATDARQGALRGI